MILCAVAMAVVVRPVHRDNAPYARHLRKIPLARSGADRRSEFSKFYVVTGVPHMIIIDRTGTVVGLVHNLGSLDSIQRALEPALDRLLEERGV